MPLAPWGGEALLPLAPQGASHLVKFSLSDFFCNVISFCNFIFRESQGNIWKRKLKIALLKNNNLFIGSLITFTHLLFQVLVTSHEYVFLTYIAHPKFKSKLMSVFDHICSVTSTVWPCSLLRDRLHQASESVCVNTAITL